MVDGRRAPRRPASAGRQELLAAVTVEMRRVRGGHTCVGSGPVTSVVERLADVGLIPAYLRREQRTTALTDAGTAGFGAHRNGSPSSRRTV